MASEIMSEGESFDYYRQDKPTNTEVTETEPEPNVGSESGNVRGQKSFLRKYMIYLIAASCCLMFILGVFLLALIGPIDDVDLQVSISYGGSQGSDALYVNTDDIEIRVKNTGKGTADGDKISLYYSGDNIVPESVPWTYGDIPTGESIMISISVQVKDMMKPFTLTVKVSYDGMIEDRDSIPR